MSKTSSQCNIHLCSGRMGKGFFLCCSPDFALQMPPILKSCGSVWGHRKQESCQCKLVVFLKSQGTRYFYQVELSGVFLFLKMNYLPQVVVKADMMIPYHHTKAWGQVPCEDVAMRIPLPECWIYQFRTEKHHMSLSQLATGNINIGTRMGSVKSAHRRAGKVCHRFNRTLHDHDNCTNGQHSSNTRTYKIFGTRHREGNFRIRKTLAAY